MTFTWQMAGLGYPACANQHSTGMVCHNNIEWITKVWVLLQCGSALLRWRNQFLHIKAEKSVFRLQCKQFTVNLISGSEAHMHRSDHPVNLFADAYVVSCIVWGFYITVCGESRRRNTVIRTFAPSDSWNSPTHRKSYLYTIRYTVRWTQHQLQWAQYFRVSFVSFALLSTLTRFKGARGKYFLYLSAVFMMILVPVFAPERKMNNPLICPITFVHNISIYTPS